MPPAVPEHPSVEELTRFGSGQIDPRSLERISAHVETCQSCQQTLAGLKSDTLEGLVRSVGVPANAASAANDATEMLATRGEVSGAGEGSALSVPERLGDYRIVRVLGQGGMGTVYEAVDERLKRRVALKVMRPEIAARPEARARFIREAQTAAALEHDHVVAIYQVGEEGGVPYLAMPLLRGESLEDRLKTGGTFTLAEIVRIGRQMAEGLAAAHERGLIHRDIKPANIWLESVPGRPAGEFRVKILDFGLARLANDDTHLTGTGTIVGTPAYMAPEQARGDTVDGRADLFSLGCVLYRLSTGRMAFRGETTMAILMSLATDHPSPPRELRREIPASLSDLTVRLLAKNPADRPASARAVIEHLEAETEPVSAPQLTPAPGERQTPPNRRFPWAAALAAGLLGVLLLAGVVFFWQTPDGVVRIECDDPNIKIAFDEGELKVVGAYKEPLSLKPGKHGLKIQRGDFEFETDKLIVNRGDKVVLRIEATPGKVQVVQDGKGVIGSKDVPAVVKPKGDPDRRVAEWVMTRRKPELGLLVNGQEVYVGENGKLPTEPFRIRGFAMIDPRVVDDDLNRLTDLTELTSFNLHNCTITDAGLAKLVSMTKLNGMNLERTKVTEAVLPTLRKFPALRDLVLNEVPLTEEGLKQLAAMSGLEKLSIKRTQVTEAAVKKLAAALPKCKIEWDGGVIEPTAPSGDPDRRAAEWVLSLGGQVQVNGNASVVAADADLPKTPFHLTMVTFDRKRITEEAGMANLKDCVHLTHLDLADTQVTDAALAHFDGIKSLQKISLYRTQATDKGLAYFRDCRMLTDLNIEGTKITNDGLSVFKGCKTLKSLQFANAAIGDAGLAWFKDCRNLSFLDVKNSQTTDVGLALFKGCTNLHTLFAANTKITDAGLANFAGCRALTYFGVEGPLVGDPGLAHLKECTQLTMVWMNNTKLTDVGMAHFKNCKNLEVLVIPGTSVGDAGLEYLAGLTKLGVLDLQKTKVTATGVEKLKKALPKCRIEHDGGVIEPSAATGFTNSLGLRFALVPKGKAWLGGGGGNVGQREVAFAKDFYLGVYEVTQDEWQKIMGSNPSRFSRTGDGADVVKDVADADLKQLPVEMVSWDDCQEFLKKLNEQAKDTGWTYRLPTEDEWEYACRGGPMKDASESAFSFYLEKPGNQLLPTQANFGHDKGLNRPTKVGSYAANKLGLYDLHGNVSEWTAGAGNKGGDVPNRVIRGGSFDYGEAGCGVLSRDPGGSAPTVRHAAIGLRVIRVPEVP